MRKLTAFALALGVPALAHADFRVDAKKAWSTLEPIEQYALLRDDFPKVDPNYLVDALDDKLSQLGRAGYLGLCFSSKPVVEWAICQPDVDAYDAKKALAELDADKSHVDAHGWVRNGLTTLDAAMKEHAEQVKAAIAKDPAYKQMFEIAATTAKSYAGNKNADLRALALAMDDARVSRSKRAGEGCDEKTWAAWKSAVSAIPAKRFSLVVKQAGDFTEQLTNAAATIVGEPNGYLAAVALTTCGSLDKPDIFVQFVQRQLLFWPGFRGPRNSIHQAILVANLSLDDRDARIDYPNVDRRELFTGDNNGGRLNWNGGGHGPLTAMKPSGSSVTLTFGPTKSKETQCQDYRAGKRLSRIESDGRLVYEGTCMKYAQVMVEQSPHAPIDVPKKYAEALKIGHTISFLEKCPMLAVPSLTATAPSMVFGVAVK